MSFLAETCIILAAAIASVPIFQRLGLSSVIGYLVAGMALGPYGLRIVDSADDMLHFSELGVVLFLFLVGLELKPTKIWEMRTRIFGAGTIQVVFVTLAIALIELLRGQTGNAAIVAAMGFALSSTAIGLQVLREKKLLNSPGGELSFAVLLFQDMAVIPMMAILPFLGTSGQSAPLLETLAKSVAAVLVVILGGKYLTRPMFRYVAKTNLRELFTGFSLLLILGISLLMQAAGLSMALGSFLAGVLLANSEYRHELEIDIDPFKGLLLGLFFISVGMSIDLNHFLSEPSQIILLTLAWMSVKIALLFLLAQIFRLSKLSSSVFALALSQGGEFAFVLFTLAKSGQIIDSHQQNIFNLVIALSMISTPFLLKIFEAFNMKRTAPVKAADPIEEQNSVIIAGYGRVGQIISRILHLQAYSTTVLDFDPAQIDLVRKFGYKAFYGDATRLDLLEAAGAKHAKLLVVAVDNFESAKKIVEVCQSHFTQLRLIVRVRNRADAYYFINRKVEVYRESFGSAISMGEAALRALGHSRYEAHKAALQFQHYDEGYMMRAAQHFDDERSLISLAHASRDELKKLMETDRKKLQGEAIQTDGWDRQ